MLLEHKSTCVSVEVTSKLGENGFTKHVKEMSCICKEMDQVSKSHLCRISEF